MKLLLHFASLLFVTVAVAQQHETYEYTRINDSTRQFKSSSYDVIFYDYKKSNGVKERRVTANGDVYRFSISETKGGLFQKILNSSGKTAATIFLGLVNTNNIVYGETNLKWKAISPDQWAYLLNGKEVLRCEYKNSDNKQQVEISSDSTLAFVVQLICLEKSMMNIKSRDYTGEEGGVQFGIKGGLNMSILSASINSESQFRSGLNIGFYLKVSIGKNSFFRPELYYSSQGQKDRYSYNTGVSAGRTTTELNYINVPLLFEFGKTITFQTGLQAGILLSAHEKGQITTQAVDDDLKKYMSPLDLSLVIGMGANISPRFNLGARYNYGLTDIFSLDYEPYPGLEFPEVKNRTLHFYVAYSF